MYYLFLLALFYKTVNSHSWLSCTNYKITNIPIQYDINQCSGFPRDYELQYNSDISKGFGYDTGYEFRSQNCKSNRNNNYKLPIANYSSGQEVCMVYPAKNHVAERCNNNPFIPDNGLKIFRSKQPNTESFDEEYEHKNGKHTFGTVDYKGFQNCPGFCNNNDKAVCYVCFTLENNIQEGIYSFKWTWQFNPNEYYTNCWDAYISSNNKQNSNQQLIQNKNNNQNNNQNQNNNILPFNGNPFDSMEIQCKSDDNICKDNVNKRRDSYNQYLNQLQNKKNNQNQNNQNQNNNLRREQSNTNLKYEYIENKC
jgi:hypothetical protein